MSERLSIYEVVAKDVACLVEKKNVSYGNSFNVSGEFLRLLWPQGVPVESYSDMLSFIRTFDKMKRLATEPNAFGEDARQDMVGYALLNLVRRVEEQKNEVNAEEGQGPQDSQTTSRVGRK